MKELLEPRDWLAKVDLKETYILCNLYTPIKSELRIPRVSVSRENILFHMSTFWSLFLAPWVFTKTLKPALGLLCQMGVQLVAYIDDNIILIIANCREQALEHSKAVVHFLECLWFIINMVKSLLTPDETIEFLGFTINSTILEL